MNLVLRMKNLDKLAAKFIQQKNQS